MIVLLDIVGGLVVIGLVVLGVYWLIRNLRVNKDGDPPSSKGTTE